MKNVLIALLLLLTMGACLPEKNRDDDPVEPELAGTYQVSLITAGAITETYPNSTGSSATAVVTRASDTQINVTLNETVGGNTSSESFGPLTTRKASGKDYDVILPANNIRIGNINGTDFTLDFTNGGQRFILISRK